MRKHFLILNIYIYIYKDNYKIKKDNKQKDNQVLYQLDGIDIIKYCIDVLHSNKLIKNPTIIINPKIQ